MDLKEIYGGKFWPSHLTIENYTRAFQLAPFFTFIKNSLIVSGVITFAQVVTGALAAYAFAMMEFKGKKVLFYIMLATMMIPSQAIIIANYLTIADWGIRNTYAALILPDVYKRQALDTVKKEVREKIPGVYVTSSVSHLLEIGNAEAGKGKTLLKLLKLLEISPEEAMAFGDADNDLDMIRSVKYGIAMKNATEHLKEAAYHIDVYKRQILSRHRFVMRRSYFRSH